jgi:hypothetical protein
VSPIEYIDYGKETFKRYVEAYDPALHKRKAFSHENEVRILRWRLVDLEQAAQNEQFSAARCFELENWDLETIADAVIVNPRCPDGYLKAVVSTIEHASKPLAGKVRASEHKLPPEW